MARETTRPQKQHVCIQCSAGPPESDTHPDDRGSPPRRRAVKRPADHPTCDPVPQSHPEQNRQQKRTARPSGPQQRRGSSSISCSGRAAPSGVPPPRPRRSDNPATYSGRRERRAGRRREAVVPGRSPNDRRRRLWALLARYVTSFGDSITLPHTAHTLIQTQLHNIKINCRLCGGRFFREQQVYLTSKQRD